MKKILQLFILILVLQCTHVFAQDTTACPCCTENHKAFDFWLGDWTVYNTEGQVIGSNSIVKLQNGCVIQENWTASNQTNTGTSYNYFDLIDSTWNQVWISNTGNVLKLKGTSESNGTMLLKSELTKGSKGYYYNQISWTKNDDGSVTQIWDILNENGETISKAFTGIYKKK